MKLELAAKVFAFWVLITPIMAKSGCPLSSSANPDSTLLNAMITLSKSPGPKKYLSRLIPISIILFVGGVVFAYLTVFPVAVYILIQLASEFEPMFTIGKYLSFTLTFLIPFGLVFEFPLVIYFLTSIGVVNPEWLIRNRRYAIVITVVMAAVLTPGPDPISQLIMAVPMALLYEAGILVSKVVAKKKRIREERASEEC